MPNYQFGLSWQTYTATSTLGGDEHAASNVTRVTEPRKTWRGVGIGSQIVCDQGAAVTLGAMFLNNGSVTQWTVEQSSTGTSGWTAATGSPFTVPADERVGNRLKAWLPLATTLQFLRFTVAAFRAGTLPELGALALLPVASIITLTQNVGHPTIEVNDPDTVVEFDGGGFDANSDGDAYVVDYALTQPTLIMSRGLLAQLQAIRNARDVIVWENFGNPQHAYLGRVLKMDPFAREAFVTAAALHLREYA